MGAIDTEDAARRLARVILSDIDLYSRERPKLGESREAQLEEGRKLFASRVIPDLVPVFAKVLADRAAGNVRAPATPAAPARPVNGTASTADPVQASSAPKSEFAEEPATDPSIFVPPFEDQSAPVPELAEADVVVDSSPEEAPGLPSPPRVPGASRPTIEDRPAPAPSIAARPLADPHPAAPAHVPALPPPSLASRDRQEVPLHMPPAPRPTDAPAAVAQPRPAGPPAPEAPTPVRTTPVPTARPSIPRLLAIVAVLAAIVTAFRLFAR